MKPFPIAHNHREYVQKIAQRHAKKERRAEIGKKLLRGVAKAFSRGQDKSPPAKAQSPPSNSKSAYVQNKRAANSPNIGQLSPSPARNHAYCQNKRKETNRYSYGNQRQKARISYPHR